MLPDAAKRQGYTFTVSELLRENQQRGGESKVTPSPPRLGLKTSTCSKSTLKPLSGNFECI